MAQSVPVRCPECRREHMYTPPAYPCVCGAPVALPPQRGGVPVLVRHRTWEGSWVEARCPECGAREHWPQPELGCVCGALLRLPVGPAAVFRDGESAGGGERPGTGGAAPATATPRPAFSPLTIRTAQDARAAAAQYLRWLGFADVRAASRPSASGVDLRGANAVAHVDASTAPTEPRAVETLWLNGLNDSSVAVCFSLAGYVRESRVRADRLSVALFVLDLTGTPQPVNDAADALVRTSA